MNLKPIILLGNSNSGKTATFQLFRELLLRVAKESNHSQKGADERDFEAVYTLGNRKIYVCSMGDYDDRISFGLERATQFECDTAVMAYNTIFSETYMNSNIVPGGCMTLRKRISENPDDESLNFIENNLDVYNLIFLLRL